MATCVLLVVQENYVSKLCYQMPVCCGILVLQWCRLRHDDNIFRDVVTEPPSMELQARQGSMVVVCKRKLKFEKRED
ncbi:hypothetical protein L195_g047620 [Trifolium pratense]|uniref:Uncharacterized protein n=1 Tax=Trifolium pratense TaxID=57577 RepID=A0A2K3MLA5_TRIPR|nr:hypothetical protein L195_g047620 [Trifolium pratense]